MTFRDVLPASGWDFVFDRLHVRESLQQRHILTRLLGVFARNIFRSNREIIGKMAQEIGHWFPLRLCRLEKRMRNGKLLTILRTLRLGGS